jgi:restriction system protein
MGLPLDAASNPAAPSASSGLKTFLDLLLAVWPLWVLIGVIGLAKLAYEVYRLRRLAKSGIRDIDAMDGHTFEEFLSTLFRRLGYSVENTRYRGDYGADLVVTKDGFKTAVQAKRWNKRVGLKAVQEAVASAGYYKCHRALVVANRDFTKQARVLADANNVELWDRDALVSKLLAVRGEAASSAPAVAANSTPASPPPTAAETTPASTNGATDQRHCVTCGVAVSEKVRDYCLARPQRFGGRVYCFNHQRRAPAALSPSD